MPLENDPDPASWKIKKAISWDEKFRRFLYMLSKRDQLIARFIYQTDISIKTVLSIKMKYLHKYNISSSLYKDIIVYAKSRDSNDYIFLGLGGKQVNRNHLVNTFRLHTLKAGYNSPFTPTDLSKYVIHFE